jgi:quercetin 2,3-dioxygenase
MTPPAYQTILASGIAEVSLPGDAGLVRVIAGEFSGARGPARTFTQVGLWDVRLKASRGAWFDVATGHNVSIFAMDGGVTVNGARELNAAEITILDRGGDGFRLDAAKDARVVVLSGEPIEEPVFGYGPFVMNTEAEIREAIRDYQSGKMGRLPR